MKFKAVNSMGARSPTFDTQTDVQAWISRQPFPKEWLWVRFAA